MSLVLNLTKGQVLRYVFMPQIKPRISAFLGEGFSHLAYLMAMVYQGVRILPKNHVIFRPENKNHLTLRAVMGAAAAEIEFNRHNLDKIFIFFCTLAGLILLAVQFILTLSYVMISPSFAGPTMPDSYAGFFHTASPEDVVYHMLYAVFGIPELFNAGATRNQYHVALHSLLQFYSIGLLVIAVLIVCYFVFAVLAETAQTGTPFGRRFNHVWAPIRLVVALGLLIPTGYGLNAAQWITLYAAKFGSDFASRGWVLFHQTMTDSFLNNSGERVGRPQNPELMPLIAYMMTVRTCMIAYNDIYTGANYKNVRPYIVRSSGTGGDGDAVDALSLGMSPDMFEEAYNFSGKGDILIRFGELNANVHKKQVGRVYPYCGETIIYASEATEEGSAYIQEVYFNLIWILSGYSGEFGGEDWGLGEYSRNFYERNISIPPLQDPEAPLWPADMKAQFSTRSKTYLDFHIDRARTLMAQSPRWQKEVDQAATLGWGAAGVWYNKIAQLNGSLVTGVKSIPGIRLYPSVLEYVKGEQLKQNIETPEIFSERLSDGLQMQFENELERAIAEVLIKMEKEWAKEDYGQSNIGSQTRGTGNMFIDAINLIFGTRGLFDMCANTDVHPLAQLSILGKGMVEASIRNIGGATLLGMGGIFAGGHILGTVAGVASSLLLSVATITLSMGFMLFYVLPFLPFLYFFFAVGGWVKGLFEAMVGVPLWALAHLRIDGEGLPGDAATDGYYLILEIFLRPILIIFGLLASVIIFSSMVKVLNEIFYLVVSNLSGHDANFTQFCRGIGGTTPPAPADNVMSFFRGPVDELFFTIIYAIIVYMIGMSCFKLIDLVPNNLLRYMGKSVKTFSDMQNDPAEGLMFRMSLGSQQVSGSLISIGKDLGQGVGQAVRGAREVAGPSQPPSPGG